MNTENTHPVWTSFQFANRFRRAIRKFSPTPIPEDDILALLTEAAYAPSSGNLQPYQLHWVHADPLKWHVAQACKGQKSAASAADIIVVVASPELGRRTVVEQRAYIDASSTMEPKSKAYHRKSLNMFDRILRVGSSAWWTPIMALMTLFRPSLSLLPIGHIGSRNWVARNAIFAAHTIMLAAAAKGIDTCPMEGFSASKIATLLKLPRGSVIPIVIALGYRAADARIEEQWRRPTTDVVVTH